MGDSQDESLQESAHVEDKPAVPAFHIKGMGNSIVVSVGSGEWSTFTDALAERLNSSEGFFQKGRVVLEVGARLVDVQELEDVRDILADHDITLGAVRTANDQTYQLAQDLGLEAELARPASIVRTAAQDVAAELTGEVVEEGEPDLDEAVPADREIALEDEVEEVDREIAPEDEAEEADRDESPEDEAQPEEKTAQATAEEDTGPRNTPYWHKGTLRSGQILRHAGPIFIVGDVNPGAEVLGEGDVYVWGHLRGIVHAGAGGDESAIVGAVDFDPIQVRIGSRIAMAPEDDRSGDVPHWFRKRSRSGKAEMARIVGERIVVDTWDGWEQPAIAGS